MNKPPSAQRPSHTAGLGLAALLGLVLLGISFARLIGDLRSAAYSNQLIQDALSDPIWHTRLGRNILLFALAMLLLHLGFGLACWLLAVLSGKACPNLRCSRRQWVFLWFLAGAIWLLVANAAHFAHSSLGEPYHVLATTPVLGVTPYALLTGLLLGGIGAVLLLFLYRRTSWRRSMGVIGGLALLAMVAGFSWKHAGHHADTASHAPNIVFLGIDSLRPDFVNAHDAPQVRAFMDGAVQLQDAVTPLARTFPAWMSILTGRHPHTTGAYVNLIPRNLIHTGATLPDMLREHGYRTYFAIDETRFANIDASYGFDRTMTPTIGGSDFVLTWFADTPLSNVVMNTRLGAVLFPHVYANRAAHVTYDPDTFVDRVLRAVDPVQPVFLAAHLTLPHWPYTWATSGPSAPEGGDSSERYAPAVHRADQQFGDLLAGLAKLGILDNAIVVALSDHGEALGKEDDFMTDVYPDKDESTFHSQKFGHGTSVFSPNQYRVVLGIRAYGKARTLLQQPAVRNEPVSLLDVAPTILDLLQIGSNEAFDGISMTSMLHADPAAAAEPGDRIRFTESEYNPNGFIADSMTASALAEAAKLYRLDSVTDRLLVRDNALPLILQTRQYAALLGKRSMAIAMPDMQHDGNFRFIPVPGAGESRASAAADAARLRTALQERFGIRFIDATQPRPAS